MLQYTDTHALQNAKIKNGREGGGSGRPSATLTIHNMTFVQSQKQYGTPVTEKTYLFKELYIETIIRNPKKVGLPGYRYWQRWQHPCLSSPTGQDEEDPIPQKTCRLHLGSSLN